MQHCYGTDIVLHNDSGIYKLSILVYDSSVLVPGTGKKQHFFKTDGEL